MMKNGATPEMFTFFGFWTDNCMDHIDDDDNNDDDDDVHAKRS